MNDKVKKYLRAVLKIAWILFSIIAWISFLVTFIGDISFGMWMAWGFACSLLTLPTALKFIWQGAKAGYAEGTHSYSGNLFNSAYGGIGISIHDRRYSQALITIVICVVVFLLVGPILLPIKVVYSSLELIGLLAELSVDKKFTIKALKITGIVLGILILILIIISIVDALSTLNENYEISSEETAQGYSLSVKRLQLGSALDESKYTLSVSDENAAFINDNEELIVDNGGYVVVRATSNKDKNDYIEKSFFIPYETVEESGTGVVSNLTSKGSEEFWISLAKVVAEDAYNIFCATRADKLFDVFEGLCDMFITFSDDDAYLFSSAMGKYHVENELLYVVSDWTNGDVNVSGKTITQEELSSVVCKPYNPGYQDGDSVSNFGVNSINNLINSEIPQDKIYRFSQMDDRYEYRVVVRGSFDYGVSTHYYRHGLLTGFFGAIKNIAKANWDELSDQWMETREYNEISNLTGLRVCVEYREK